MSEPSAMFLQLFVENGLGEARINDLPVARHTSDGVTNSAIPIQEYLIDGENTLKLHAVPMDADNPGRFKSIARIARFSHGELMTFEGGKEIARIEWQPIEHDAPRGVKFVYGSMHRWKWQDTPVLMLDAKTIDKLDAYVAEVRREFLTRRADALVSRQKLYYEERALAYPPPSVVDDGSLFAGDLRGAPAPWTLAALDLSAPRYRLVADGRLVECVGEDGLALVRNIVPDGAPEPEQLEFPFPMMLGLVDGSFTIMR